MKETVINLNKKNAGEVELADAIFGQKPNKGLIYEAVKMSLAGRREGTAATRNHCMVSGTTAKMYRQKGTGRARHGDARTNIFVGGGKAFGPHPRDYSYKLPKKARKGAVGAALALKRHNGKLVILDNFEMAHIKTKTATAALCNLGVRSALIVVDGENRNVKLSVRNIPNVKIVLSSALNVVDLLQYEHVIITVPALAKVQASLLPASA